MLHFDVSLILLCKPEELRTIRVDIDKDPFLLCLKIINRLEGFFDVCGVADVLKKFPFGFVGFRGFVEGFFRNG